MAALEEGGGVWRGGQDVKRRRARAAAAAAAAAPEPLGPVPAARPPACPPGRGGAFPALGSLGSRRRGAVPAALLLPGVDVKAASPGSIRGAPAALDGSATFPAAAGP